MKQNSNGINEAPSFTGVQEFYKDFITVAASNLFNRHLKDVFVNEILELNGSKFEVSEIEDEDSVDASTRQNYLKCVKSLRIIAKFLGYLESLPYKYETLPNDKILSAEISTRKFYKSELDVKNVILNSIRESNLILSIPWVTEYLAMLDYVTVRLPYFTEVYELLFSLYASSFLLEQSVDKSSLILIKFCLGWLFELPNFPSDQYFAWISKPLSRPLKFENSKRGQEIKLDHLDLIDQVVLFACCPYLEEIKKLLQMNNTRSGITVKHITPLTAAESYFEVTEKRLKVRIC